MPDPLLLAGTMAFLLVLVGGAHLLVAAFDELRIRAFLIARGGHLVLCTWRPGGARSLAFSFHRRYDVTYRDERGDLHDGVCHVSLVPGLRLTRQPDLSEEAFDPRLARVTAEVARLRGRPPRR